LFHAIHARNVRNPVVVTGDMHRNLAANLLTNFDVPESRVLGVEFVGTSISSGQDGEDLDDGGENILRVNPHVEFTNQQRGYTRCTTTPQLCRAEFQVMEYVSDPGAPIRTRASYITEEGNPGLQQESGAPARPTT
jgi:alkaline phosphatase D